MRDGKPVPYGVRTRGRWEIVTIPPSTCSVDTSLYTREALVRRRLPRAPSIEIVGAAFRRLLDGKPVPYEGECEFGIENPPLWGGWPSISEVGEVVSVIFDRLRAVNNRLYSLF